MDQIQDGIQLQKAKYEKEFESAARFSFHDTQNSVVRYVRDRRLNIALDRLRSQLTLDISDLNALVVCGGVGGEATFLRKAGFKKVTNSDFSENALQVCRERDPQLGTICLNAENMDLLDESYDVVLVQDGLHHLPRPILGFNEMLRVARHAVVVLEPHAGLAGNVLGREWEEDGGAINYVFRWDGHLIEQVTRSQILKIKATVESIRLWDHNSTIHKSVCWLGGGKLSLIAAKVIYAALKPINVFGNNFIGIVVKQRES